LETDIREYESRFSVALAQVDQGEVIEGREDTLRQLIWTLAIRTRAVRDQFQQLTEDLFGAMVNSFESDEAHRAIIKGLEATLPAIQEETYGTLSEYERTFLEPLDVQTKSTVEEVEQMLSAGLIRQLFGELRYQIEGSGGPKIAEEGQLKGLAKVLEFGGAPDSFRPTNWEVLEFQAQELVLGDGCVVATTADGQPVSLLQSNTLWENIYLPISPFRVLAAGRGKIPTLSADAINQASVELSVSQFFCSSAEAATPELLTRIGRRAVVLSREDMAEMFADGWKEQDP
jgi:hypothetical protein